jgi:hypothetical protein
MVRGGDGDGMSTMFVSGSDFGFVSCRSSIDFFVVVSGCLGFALDSCFGYSYFGSCCHRRTYCVSVDGLGLRVLLIDARFCFDCGVAACCPGRVDGAFHPAKRHMHHRNETYCY